MDREKALELLKGGVDGIGEWNRRRGEGEEIPDLSRANLGGAYIADIKAFFFPAFCRNCLQFFTAKSGNMVGHASAKR